MQKKYLWIINLFSSPPLPCLLHSELRRGLMSQWTCCVGDDLKIFEQTHCTVDCGGFLWRFWKEILTWKHLQWLFDSLTLNKSDVILLNNDSKLGLPGSAWYDSIISNIPPDERKLLLVWRGITNIKTKQGKTVRLPDPSIMKHHTDTTPGPDRLALSWELNRTNLSCQINRK